VIRTGFDKVYLVAENEEAAKAISGRIEWLASHASILRLKSVAVGFSLDQKTSIVIIPSQKRVQKGEKLRKKAIRKRQANLEKYKRPKGERRRKKEPKEKRKERKNWKESADPKVKS
jgi:hypothetical protein